MKIYFLLFISIIIFSCCEKNGTKDMLSTIDQMIVADDLDSAQSLIDSIRENHKSITFKDRNRYDLLQMFLKVKKQISIDTLAEVKRIYDFYQSSDNARDRMIANYIQGCVYRDRGDAVNALVFYRKAIENTDTSDVNCDYKTLSRIYGQIAYLFNLQHVPKYELEAEWNAEKMAWKAKDTLAAIRFHEFLVGAYYFKGDKDSALIISNQTSHLYEKYGKHYDLASRAQSTAILINIERRNYENAKNLIDNYEKYSRLFDEEGNILRGYEFFYYLKGMYYEGICKYDSAQYYYTKLLQFKDDIDLSEAAYKGLTSLYTLWGNADSIGKYARLYCDINDSSNLKNSSQEIVKMQALYDYTESLHIAKKKDREAALYKSTIIIFTLLVVLFVMIIYIYIKHLKRKRKDELVMANLQYSEILSQYRHALSDMHSLQKGYDYYKKEKQNEVEKLQRMLAFYYDDNINISDWDIEQAVLNSAIVRRIHQLANRGMVISDSEIQQLYELTNKNFPFLYRRIIEEPTLTNRERDVCIFIKYRFIPTEIATLLDMTKQRITNIRRSINKKLFLDERAKTLDSNIRSI